MNNNDDGVDLLQIRIENAKAKLPVETVNAIAAVDWKAAILSLRTKKGFSFEQLADLELETELMLCGLTNAEQYPKELQTRMRLSKADTDELVNDMNMMVFQKIKAEMIKNSENKKVFQARSTIEPEQSPVRDREGSQRPSVSNEMNKADATVLKSAGIELSPVRDREASEGAPVSNGIENRDDLLKKVENPEPAKIVGMHPAFQEKILGSVQTPVAKTEHIAENIPAAPIAPETPSPTISTPKVDPYREIPE